MDKWDFIMLNSLLNGNHLSEKDLSHIKNILDSLNLNYKLRVKKIITIKLQHSDEDKTKDI